MKSWCQKWGCNEVAVGRSISVGQSTEVKHRTGRSSFIYERSNKRTNNVQNWMLLKRTFNLIPSFRQGRSTIFLEESFLCTDKSHPEFLVATAIGVSRSRPLMFVDPFLDYTASAIYFYVLFPGSNNNAIRRG